jgi:DNA-binding transcriptional ArsR family regulator
VSEPYAALARLDKLIHEPARLAITTALASCDGVDFTFLQRITGLSKGNLSGHLMTLEAAGIIELTKSFVGRRPKTWIRLTELGSYVLDDYWSTMARAGQSMTAGREKGEH